MFSECVFDAADIGGQGILNKPLETLSGIGGRSLTGPDLLLIGHNRVVERVEIL
jgi:hypothetical protein